MMQRAVFLDRDGVLNAAIVKKGKPYPPASVHEVIIPANVLTALNLLKQAGFLLIGATNQPDVARGTTDKTVVEAINARLLTELPLDELRVCYHDDSDQCQCRKPMPGLLTQAANDHGIDLAQSYMVGDRWKDISAGKEAGCKTIWIDYQYQEDFLATQPDFTTCNLLDAAHWIINSLKG